MVFEAHDRVKNETYYRPLGGHIEFGEYSTEAVRRELCEETGSEIEDLRFQQIFENIYINEGIPGHEIVFLFEGDLSDKTIYARQTFYIHEEVGTPVKVFWKPLADFEDGGPPLYPYGLLKFLKERDASF